VQRKPRTDAEAAAIVEAALTGTPWASCPVCNTVCVTKEDKDHATKLGRTVWVDMERLYVVQCHGTHIRKAYAE
jgi:hypothetical protein